MHISSSHDANAAVIPTCNVAGITTVAINR